MKKLLLSLAFISLISFTNAQWITLNSGTTNSLSSVYFTNYNTGYAISNYNSMILKTINAGHNWTSQTIGTGYLSSIYFINTDTGYAVGFDSYNGVSKILKTSNAGNSWTALSSATNYALTSVYFTDTNTGYIVCANGKILKTINAGANWTEQTSGANYLYSVFFTDADTGYAVGSYGGGGTIIKTTNAGNSWPGMVNITYPSALSSVYFTNADTGYAVGLNSNGSGTGIIYQTSNAGSSWVEQTSGTTHELYSVHFINTDTGYTVGNAGTILKTTNAGSSWVSQTSGTTNGLYSVYFIDASNGYAVGQSGTILKISNCGTPFTINNPQTICKGGSYIFNGHTYTTTGNYHDTLTTVHGCDSIITTQLTVNPVDTTQQANVICQGNSYNFFGTQLTMAGTYYHTLTSSHSCDSVIKLALTVTIVPANAGSAQSICPGDSTTLTATGGAAYIWSNGGIIATTSVKPTTTTTYTVTVYDMSGCSATANVVVTVKPTPPTPVISTVGSALLSNASAGNQWYLNGTVLIGQTNTLCVPSVTGNYFVIVTQNGCISDTSNVIHVVIAGLTDLSDNKNIYIYPNPVTNNLQIQTDLQIKNVEITDITGRQLYTTTSKTIDCSNFAKGVYFIKAFTEKGIAVKKFVKE